MGPRKAQDVHPAVIHVFPMALITLPSSKSDEESGKEWDIKHDMRSLGMGQPNIPILCVDTRPR